MSVHKDLRDYLLADSTITALVGQRVYVEELPQNSPLPAITFLRVNVDHDHDLEGETGLATARFQIDSWADSPLNALALAERVRLRLDGYQGTMGSTTVQSILLDAEREWSEEIEARVLQEFLVSYTEAVP